LFFHAQGVSVNVAEAKIRAGTTKRRHLGRHFLFGKKSNISKISLLWLSRANLKAHSPKKGSGADAEKLQE
jgi:hypothetical protein